MKDESDKVYLPLAGGTITGALTVNKELYSNASIISKRNSCPQFIMQNANGVQLGSIYSGTSDGSYSDILISVNRSSSDIVYFGFSKDGQFMAPGSVYGSRVIAKANNYPQMGLYNEDGSPLSLWLINTSSGEYSNAILRVNSSASDYKEFVFSNQGSFRAPSTIYSSLFAVQSDNNPQLMLQNASGAPLGILYINTTTGDYSSAQLRVYSSASTYSTFNFGNDGKLSCGSLALATALPISSGGTGATTATNALINLNGNAAKGSATVPIYWTGSAWATITSYSGKASTAGTADKVANALSINGKTYNGSTSIDVGVIGAAYGGSGKTTLETSANAFLGALPIWVTDPTDDTYLIRQDTAGALSYGKVKFNTVYNYIKGKTDTLYLPLSGGTLTGPVIGKTKSNSWIIMSHNGAFNMSTAPLASGAASVVTAKTQNGSWGIGTLFGDNSLYFVYGTDANYNANSNETVHNVRISNAGGVYGAVWNDYAEFRVTAEQVTSGQVVYSDNRGELHKTTERLQAFEGVVSDTFGFAIGETDKAKTPLAVAGRVLVYPDEDRYAFHAGDAVCAGKFGTVSKMTREEIIAYPDRIVGIVSEIPEYETWGSGNVPVYNRIWIRVK